MPKDVEILVAEDSPTQAMQLRLLLEGHGYAVVTAPNGRAALAAARRRQPDLVVSDVMMPELDGYGLCKALKADEQLKGVPVMLVTALSDPRDVVRGLECGADNFVRKPYDEQYLLSRIHYLLMNRVLRTNQKMRMGVEIDLGGQKHFITAERQQILDLLISTYEQAIHINNELKLREAELAHSNQVLKGLYRVAEGLNHGVGERDVAEAALERALELPGIEAGWISLREDEGGFRVAAARGLPPALCGPGALDGPCDCRRRLLNGELDRAVNITECERLPRTEGDTPGSRLHASVPLWLGGTRDTLGVMNLIGVEDRLFDEGELEVLYGVANQVAVALDRAKLHEHLERLVAERTAALTEEIAERKAQEARVMRLNRVYAVLSGINTTIVRVRDRQELFDEACRIAVEHGGFRLAWIGLLDADSERLVPVAQAGHDRDYLTRINLTTREEAAGGCRLVAQTLRQARPRICNDIATDARLEPWRGEALSRDYRSLAMFPLLLDERPVGVFTLYAPEQNVFDDEEIKLLVEMAGDISFALDHLKKEERLNYLAYFDAVTELPNRALFLDRAGQRIGTAHHGQQGLGVIMLDLERFSSINESFGRQAGDSLLCQVAQRLRQHFDETDVVARLNADYFGITTRRDSGDEGAARLLEGMLAGVQRQPFLIDGQELRVAARAGISFYPADGDDIETLLNNAEAALKQAKLSGERSLRYVPEFNVRVAEKLSLENKLRRALDQGQLLLYYQPKADLRSGRISGVEALLRWNDPETGLVLPLKFIPLLEETGMILAAGRWALAQALADARAWRAQGLRPPRVAVNVSQIQLHQKDFVGMVAAAIGGGDADELELEITESLIMKDIESNIQKLRAVRDMGVEVAIDDFGTGYSSLSYIAKLPVSALKIDRAFITNVAHNADDLSIVSTIISLAHTLNLRVVAEGVENEEQANLLRLLKCDEIQGFLFSPAVPAAGLEEFLRKTKGLPGMV